MGGIIGGIVQAVLQFTYGAIAQWYRERQHEIAVKKAETLDCYIKAKADTDKETAEYQKLVDDKQKADAVVTTWQEKLAKIKEFNKKGGT